jgi:uncharacterized protein
MLEFFPKSRSIYVMFIDEEFESYACDILTDPEFLSSKNYMAHGPVSVYDHSLLVAERAYLFAKKHRLNLDYRSLVRGALLHDFYLYDWHKKHRGHRLHGFRHPSWALHNASLRFELNPIERDIIQCHMYPLTFWHRPHYREAWLVRKIDHHEANLEMRYHDFPSLQKLAMISR